MTRTTAAVMIVGSALALSACSSHSGSSAGTTSSTSSTSASASAGSTAPASSSPSAGASMTPSAGAQSSATVASSAPASTPATTIPATVTSPGSKPTATTSASPTTTAQGSSTRCRNAQLKVSLGTEGAAAGNRYTPLIFTNTGTTSCTLVGHPGVSYVAGDKGVQVGDSAKRDPGTVRTITLAPGGAASALIHEANYQNFDPSACKAVTTRGFRVYPPGSTAAFFVPRPAKECSGTGLPGTALSIGVVKAGANPSA